MVRPKVKVSEARSFRIRKDLGTRLDDYSEWIHIPKTVKTTFQGNIAKVNTIQSKGVYYESISIQYKYK